MKTKRSRGILQLSVSSAVAPPLAGLVLVMAGISAPRSASATDFTLEIITCEGIFHGVWNQATSTCTVKDFALAATDKLIIASTQTLVLQGNSVSAGEIDVSGRLKVENVFDNAGVIENSGDIDFAPGSGATNRGKIELSAPGFLDNEGAFNNDGIISSGVSTTFNNFGSGTFDNNTGALLSNAGAVNNFSSMNNFGNVVNSGEATLSNRASGSLTNQGTLHNTFGASVFNQGRFSMDVATASLEQDGRATLSNSGTFTITSATAVLLNSGGTVNNSGSLTSEADITNSEAGRFDNSGALVLGVDASNTLSPAVLHNDATARFANSGQTRIFGQIINSGTIVNDAAASEFLALRLDNVAGTVNNSARMSVVFDLENHNLFVNSGSLFAGFFVNFCSASLENSGSVGGPVVNFQGSVTNTGTIPLLGNQPDCRQ